MFKFLCFMFSLLTFTNSAQAADWEGIYAGTLGKSPVLVQLVEPPDDGEGYTGRETSRYSYLPRTRDLNLMLSSSAMPLAFEETLLQSYEFKEAKGLDRKVTGTWVLVVTGDKASGTWTSPDGKKRLPIVLARKALLDDADVNPDDNIVNATYNSQWLKDVTFADAGKAKDFADVELRWAKDSAFGIAYPVIGKFPDAARKASANAMLMAAHRRSIGLYRDCKNGVPISWEEAETAPEFSYEVIYASANVLSVVESGSVFCGGAHPGNYVTYKTYDLVNAKQLGGAYLLDLSPAGFGMVLKLANKMQRIAFEGFALKRWDEAAKAAGSSVDESCVTLGFMAEQPPGEKDFALAFAASGLAVHRTDYPHAASNCLAQDYNPVIIPWQDLKAYLREDQKLLTTEIQ